MSAREEADMMKTMKRGMLEALRREVIAIRALPGDG